LILDIAAPFNGALGIEAPDTNLARSGLQGVCPERLAANGRPGGVFGPMSGMLRTCELYNRLFKASRWQVLHFDCGQARGTELATAARPAATPRYSVSAWLDTTLKVSTALPTPI
jgi:hypothetical protein